MQRNESKGPVLTRLPEISPKDLEVSSVILGSGAQGVAKKGLWQGTTEVAVKTIELSRENIFCLKREINVLDFLNWPGIIRTYGYCQDDSNFSIVMELIEGDNLNSILFKPKIRSQYRIKIGSFSKLH